MEYHVFLKEYLQNPLINNELRGYLSWKFGKKSGISGTDFVNFVSQNPGADVYFINPFPKEAQLYSSVWQQAESCHPGLTHQAQIVLDCLNIDVDLEKIVNNDLTTAYCNYWVGNKKFWDRYIKFTKPIYEAINRPHFLPNHDYWFRKGDRKIKATYIPFLFERLFSTLLATDQSLSVCAYQYTPEELASKDPFYYRLTHGPHGKMVRPYLNKMIDFKRKALVSFSDF